MKGNECDRKKDILDASKRLFTANGYAATSIRDIAKAAGVPIALIRYYFGNKPELFEYIFRLQQDNNACQMASLGEVKEGAPRERLEKLIRVWADPFIDENYFGDDIGDDDKTPLLVARAFSDTDEVNRSIVQKYYDPVAHAFVDAIADIFPNGDRILFYWIYNWALAALFSFIADTRIERLTNQKAITADPEMRDKIIGFIVSGSLSVISDKTS